MPCKTLKNDSPRPRIRIPRKTLSLLPVQAWTILLFSIHTPRTIPQTRQNGTPPEPPNAIPQGGQGTSPATAPSTQPDDRDAHGLRNTQVAIEWTTPGYSGTGYARFFRTPFRNYPRHRNNLLW